ncbi:MAG: hypothetical protein AMJ81_03890, partial [Phycisphaerae bacterium SM23_33]
MRTAAFLQGAWALLLFAAAGGAGRPTGAEGLPGAGPGASPHDREHHLPQVTSITFSPDGRRLVASYYVLAMNRPGTDWQCWTAQWNLETGQRLIIPDTCAPVTFHPDGATMAMGFYERSGKPGRLSAPARLALWKPGADLPARGLKPPKDDQSSVLAATFNLNGDRLLAMTAAGGLLAWHTRKDEPPEILDKVKRDVQPPGRWGLPRPKMALSQGDVLLAAFPPSPGRAEGWAVSWRYARSSSRPDAYALERLKTYEGGLITWDARAVTVMGRLPRKGWAYSFACEKAEAEPWRRRRLYDGVAFSPDARSLAFSARGKVSVNLYDGQRLRHFPAGGGAVCFSPDGKALAAGDTRGIIRLWELQSGRLLRTLRLDDRPADTVLVAAIQCYSKFGDPAGNRTRLAALVRRADHAGAKIVVLPETAVTGYLSADLKKTWRVGKRQVSDGLEGVDPKDAA